MPKDAINEKNNTEMILGNSIASHMKSGIFWAWDLQGPNFKIWPRNQIYPQNYAQRCQTHKESKQK